MQSAIPDIPLWVLREPATQVSVQNADANLGHHPKSPLPCRFRP